MKIETIRKSHNKSIIACVVAFLIIAIVLIVEKSFAKYELVKSIKIAEGTINYKVPDFKIMAMYKNDGNGDSEIETMPTGDYIINESKSYCTLDNVNKDSKAKLYTDSKGNHVISGLSKSSKCYLYFEKGRIADTVLGRLKINVDKINISKQAKKTCEGIESYCETTNGIYATNDNDGESYFYRGHVENNYLKFAGFYWRVIRVNGDGTVRIIYQGKTIDATGEDAQIGKSAFNPYAENNMYAGFKYTDGQVHGTSEKSIILKDSLEPWYQNNLISYASKIDINAGFCNDRTPSTSETEINNQGGAGNTLTYYRGYVDLWKNRKAMLTCPNEDVFTHKTSNKGNKSLDYPIGLITGDELSFAGSTYGLANNRSYYLYTGANYWTMTPMYYFYDGAHNTVAFIDVYEDGQYYGHISNGLLGVRPVINIRSDVKITGNGTITNPYIVA